MRASLWVGRPSRLASSMMKRPIRDPAMSPTAGIRPRTESAPIRTPTTGNRTAVSIRRAMPAARRIRASSAGVRYVVLPLSMAVKRRYTDKVRQRRNRRSALSLVGNHDQFADEVLRHEIGLGAMKFRQRINTADERPDLAAFDIADQPAEVGAASLARSMQFQLLQIHGPEVELDDRPGDRAGRRVTAFGTQDLQEIVEQRPADEIGDDIDRLSTACGMHGFDKIALAAGNDRFGADLEHRRLLAGTGDGDRDSAAGAGELDDCRADAAGGAGDEDAFAGGKPRPLQHALTGQIGAAEGGEFDIGQIGCNDMGVFGRQRHIFGITAVAAMAHVIDVGKAVVVAVVDREIDHDALADAFWVDAGADADDMADRIGALDAGEGQRIALPAPSGDGGRIVLGAVSALAHPDVGVVHAAGGDADQHFALRRRRDGHLPVIDELVQSAMTGQQYGRHLFRDRHAGCSPQMLLKTVSIASAVALTMTSASSRVRQSGGAKPRISPCGMARPMMPRSRRAAATCGPILRPASKKRRSSLFSTNSTAAIRPSPRTSPTLRWPPTAFSSSERK
ncbi:hypothetical protein RHECNPAF_23300106 [Rhizobium etli CNPAF512]|nr:hypothetical protein RHECNPAF_23300106 [Rhizobium etli CNPAF512]